MLFEFYRTALEEIMKRLFYIYSETAGSQHLPYISSNRTNLFLSISYIIITSCITYP